jgi:cystathionine beta-lyase
MNFENLESVIDPEVKTIILCNPHNPGGSVWTKDELTQLGDLCAKHDVFIIADEIHSDLILNNNKFTPMASISEVIAKNVITCMAPSKTFNLAGLSTSIVICSNPQIMERYNKMLRALHLGLGNLFGMVALEASYTFGEEWLDQLLDYLSLNLEFLTSFIYKNIPEIKIIKPEATYLVWLDFRELKMNNKELKDFLIHKAKLGFNDGPIFGQGGEGFQRMNIACPRALLEKALIQLESAIKLL